MTPKQQERLDALWRKLHMEALFVIEHARYERRDYLAMLREPKRIDRWWDGVFPPDAESNSQLDSAARAIAHGLPVPPLSHAQRGRLALRLLLGSRALRALTTPDVPPTGWFASKLARMSRPELVEWLLTTAAPMWLEVFGETLDWQDDVPVDMKTFLPPDPPASFGHN